MAEGKNDSIPREEIPWFPTIEEALCTNCGICLEFCPNGVYALVEAQTRVVSPYTCTVGCSQCETKCSPGAIRFPDMEEFAHTLRELRARYAQ
jgi:NAD-dependent dihydropyrimidine dehydrogenase PreA subunit